MVDKTIELPGEGGSYTIQVTGDVARVAELVVWLLDMISRWRSLYPCRGCGD